MNELMYQEAIAYRDKATLRAIAAHQQNNQQEKEKQIKIMNIWLREILFLEEELYI